MTINTMLCDKDNVPRQVQRVKYEGTHNWYVIELCSGYKTRLTQEYIDYKLPHRLPKKLRIELTRVVIEEFVAYKWVDIHG